ncbi:MAG TPA: hypothetical protein VND64_15860 [Pirellulales bacterium]|nr:hypothetical protein [Pirellulales bacterium]
MRRFQRSFLAGCVVLSAIPALAVDYAKIDRRLLKEPVYAHAPDYALLLFGREARFRVWLVSDGKTVYLDRDGDGDLTDEDERFADLDACANVELADPDGNTRYRITRIGAYTDDGNAFPDANEDAGDVAKRPPKRWMVNLDVLGALEYQQYCDLEASAIASEAKLAHFHGALTIGPRTISWMVPAELALTTGDKPTDLYACIGTMSAEHGCWVVVRTHKTINDSAFAAGVVPVVEVEFAAKMAGQAAVKKRYQLDKFC